MPLTALTVSSDSEDEAPRFRRSAAFKKRSANSSPGSESNANNQSNNSLNHSNDLDKSDLKEMSPFNALELPLSIFQRREMEADIARRQKIQAAEAQIAQKRQMEEMQKQLQIQRMEEMEMRVREKAEMAQKQAEMARDLAQRKAGGANDSFVPISRGTGAGGVTRPAESATNSSSAAAAASAAAVKGAQVATNNSTSSPSSSSRNNRQNSPPLAPAASRLTSNINVRQGVKSSTNTNAPTYGALLSNSSRNVANVGNITGQTPPQVSKNVANRSGNATGSGGSPSLSYSALLNQSPSILTATGYTNLTATGTGYSGYNNMNLNSTGYSGYNNNNRIDNRMADSRMVDSRMDSRMVDTNSRIDNSRMDPLMNSVSSSVRLPSAVAGNLSPESRKRTAPWYQKVIQKEEEVARLQGVMSERSF
jgi:hypothetical protein